MPLTPSSVAIEDVIPQRQGMKLLDRLVQAGGEETIAEAVVKDSWPGCLAGSLDPVMLVELAAQSAGAHVGWARLIAHQPVSIGLLVGVRNSWLTGRPIPVGTLLRVRIRPEYGMEGYSVFHSRVSAGEASLAEIEVQVFEPAEGQP
jgi:predicted hotdog family 3-hydroxylacyl-ACP dehydratase